MELDFKEEGARIFIIISLFSHTSYVDTISAPFALNYSSENYAVTPAPSSTFILNPSFTNFKHTFGVIAIRFSNGSTSFGTPITLEQFFINSANYYSLSFSITSSSYFTSLTSLTVTTLVNPLFYNSITTSPILVAASP